MTPPKDPTATLEKVDKLITRCEESMYHHTNDRTVARKELLDLYKTLHSENQKLREENKELKFAIRQFPMEVGFANGNKETIKNCRAEAERYAQETLDSLSLYQPDR